MKLNIATLVIGLLAVTLLVAARGNQPWTALRLAGIVIGSPALALLIVARIQLGRSFSVAPEATAIVTHGLYSRIRHPIYVFSSLFIVGLILYMQHPLWLLALIVLIPVQILRARAEERILTRTFGKKYERYKAKTWL
ncbi:MAG TPA: isoprenylcysteine carboxylmethyltransferase family protein [Terriglobia bacterium]|jgi:protein-S-isoprenylcysteine O-methyltransferase Ste14